MWLLLTVVFTTTIHNALPANVVTCEHANDVLHVLNSTESECLRESEVDGVVFPKCCPLEFVYDTQTHSCKKGDLNHFFEEHEFFKIGLRSCVFDAVIVDFATDSQNFYMNEANGTALLTINETTHILQKGEFCVDDRYNSSSNSSIVVRVCSANKLKDECGKNRKCLRKCCPDFEIFNESRACTPSVEQPLDYNNWEKASKIVAGIHPTRKPLSPIF